MKVIEQAAQMANKKNIMRRYARYQTCQRLEDEMLSSASGRSFTDGLLETARSSRFGSIEGTPGAGSGGAREDLS